MKISKTSQYKILFITFCTLFASSVSLANTKVFSRKSVLTVAENIYTDMDAQLILWIWNQFAAKPLKISTNWVAGLGLSQTLNSLPDDAKILLFVTMAWSESKRLNLFASSKKELESKLDIADDTSSILLLDADAQRFWKSAGKETKLSYLDIVSRAIAYDKVRGGFDKNPGLTNLPWYWHDGK